MRRVIACEYCRKRKSKCIHSAPRPPISVYIPSVKDSVVLKNVFTNIKKWFPELLFLHLPSLQLGKAEPVVLNALLALYNCIKDESEDIDGLGINNFDVYYNRAVLELSTPTLIFESPTLEAVESLLILTMLDWHRDNHYKSRMMIGIASSMVESFDRLLKRGDDLESGLDNDSAFNSERVLRIFWSCFIIERVISGGRDRNSSLNFLNVYSVSLPVCEEKFLYMNSVNSVAESRLETLGSFNQLTFPENENNSGSFLIRLYELWGKIMNFLVKGGRRTYRDPPWSEKSVFYLIKAKLYEFYTKLPECWKWSRERFHVHTLRGSENEFVMVNILYNLCLVCLSREYVPFFPHSNDKPVGPTESPILPAPPDPEFWNKNSLLKFDSARALISIIRCAEEDETCGIKSPFYAYCIYTAALSAFYGSSFHWMDPHASQYIGDPEYDFSITGMQMMQILSEKSKKSSISLSWVNTAYLVCDLYKAISNNREKAIELQLGRNSLRRLEDSIQMTNTGHDTEESRELINAVNTGGSGKGVTPSELGGDNETQADFFVMSQDFLLSGNDNDQVEFLARILKEMTE
ncbi:hypothetical protein PSN45_003657 [Yamadazyma tenuis]|uniref:uncharacterized protein n=1 Tax=Candida tenuis TaxID=2315449 RepID=UPI00279CC838|nr:hypothetical protein PSN45_003657 [Yamadazyma tenuis]